MIYTSNELALTVANGDLVQYLIYLVGAMVLAVIGLLKWLTSTVGPLMRGFFDDHKETMGTARQVMEKMGDTTSNIQLDVVHVKETLNRHGEKLDIIDKRTSYWIPRDERNGL